MLYNAIFNRIPIKNKILFLNNIEDNSCYIFGDGKSLKYYDLKNFSLLPSISIGNLSIHNDVELLNYKYSIICDPFVCVPKKNGFDYLRRSYQYFNEKEYKKTKDLLLPPSKIIKATKFSIHKLLFSNNDSYLKTNKVFHCSNYYFSKHLENCFYYNNVLILNDKIDKCILNSNYNIFASSLRFSIYFAIMLGFKKIYLVSCDYIDIEPRVGHWFETGKPIISTGKNDTAYLDFMRQFVEIKVITLKKSYGENYISYKDFFGKDLEYKENFEIVSREKLEILKYWDYNIYNDENK